MFDFLATKSEVLREKVCIMSFNGFLRDQLTLAPHTVPTFIGPLIRATFPLVRFHNSLIREQRRILLMFFICCVAPESFVDEFLVIDLRRKVVQNEIL